MPSENVIVDALAHWGEVPLPRLLTALTQVSTGSHSPWELVRELETRCYIDIPREGPIRARPPIAFRVPRRGLPRVILAGCATSRQYVELETSARRAGAEWVKRQPTRLSPPLVQADDWSTIEAWANSASLPLAPSIGPLHALAQASSVRNLQTDSAWETQAEPNLRRRDFSLELLRFGPPDAASPRLSAYQNVQTQQWQHILVSGGKALPVERRLGIYGLASLSGRRLLAYQPVEAALIVPSAAPMPPALSRAAFLCSGEPPRRTLCPVTGAYGQGEAFTGVSPVAAASIMELAGQGGSLP